MMYVRPSVRLAYSRPYFDCIYAVYIILKCVPHLYSTLQIVMQMKYLYRQFSVVHLNKVYDNYTVWRS